MQSFLERTVEHLSLKYGEGLPGLCIVLPNRRAGLFFRKHLAKSLKKPTWAPEIFSTDDFIARISGLTIADTVTQLFALYGIYRDHKGADAEDFGSFSRWAGLLLNDFSEADSSLADTEKLFRNLAEVREIENWSLSAEQLSDLQKDYLKFWDSLGHYYHELGPKLLKQNMAYKGQAYRIAADNIEQRIKEHSWTKVIFAGFNAMSAAEEKIIKILLQSGKAEALWDTDTYYTNDKVQEAGKFLRRYKKDSVLGKEFLWEDELIAKEEKDIHVIGVPKGVAQAKAAGEILSSLKEKAESSTALVLADENLLFPVLHSLPASIQNVNVTMGYRLRNTPLYSLFEAVFRLHENARGKTSPRFYHKDLLRFLSHPYTGALLYSEDISAGELSRQIRRRNIVYISEKELGDAASKSEVLGTVLKKWENASGALDTLSALLELMKENFRERSTPDEKKQDIELEYLLAFSKVLKRIRSIPEREEFILEPKTLRGILQQVLRNATLPFSGEPLSGLQVMGMLETRALDFENVILLSANENILPSGRTHHSFIPYDLRKAYGLPVYSDRDSIFAYHFYRLLQRSKNIWLLYNTETDTFGNGEQSRFITQLLSELPTANPKVKISRQLLYAGGTEAEESGISISKSKEVIEALEQKAAKGFSPSLLNKYINCPLQFYFHAVAGLREADEVEESIGADVLGSVIHAVLQDLYTPHLSVNITAGDIQKMIPRVEELMRQKFLEHFRESDLAYGKNLLAQKVALRFVNNYLKKEAEALEAGEKLQVNALEVSLEATMNIGKRTILLKGTADRIDRKGGITRIVDYKTGKAGDKELELEDWEQLRLDSSLAKSFQLLMYAWLYSRTQERKEDLVSGIISFRELSAGLKPVSIQGETALNADKLNKFEEQLQLLLKDIFDERLPFSQTEEPANCVYCDFREICRR